MNLMKTIDGHKTNIGLIAAGVLGVLVSLDKVDAELAGAIGSVIGAWTGIAIRSAYKKGK